MAVGVEVWYSGEEFSIDFLLLLMLSCSTQNLLIISSQIILLWKSFYTKYFLLSYAIGVHHEDIPFDCISSYIEHFQSL